MKYLLSLFILITLTLNVQAQEDTANYMKYPNAYGPQYKDIWATRMLRIPDTSYKPKANAPGAIARNPQGTKMYIWNGAYFEDVGGTSGNTESTTQTFTGDGETYDFTISTPNINNFSAPVYLDYHPGDELPATQGANSVTLHYNLPPPDGQSFTVKIIYTTTAP